MGLGWEFLAVNTSHSENILLITVPHPAESFHLLKISSTYVVAGLFLKEEMQVPYLFVFVLWRRDKSKSQKTSFKKLCLAAGKKIIFLCTTGFFTKVI